MRTNNPDRVLLNAYQIGREMERLTGKSPIRAIFVSNDNQDMLQANFFGEYVGTYQFPAQDLLMSLDDFSKKLSEKLAA